MAVTVVSGDEVLRHSVPLATDQSLMHVRTDIVLELAVVLIDILWQVADPHFLVACTVVR